ncbi:MAG: bifunctional hydroxymethylpyrimidine kinase/phosphomethylpyrimidine kinase [Lachnospira sp.]|nr:bifunctional hydroxymethylpyrimidine kinase/phosphomethylpyrimidine kinase [Lachnospira sp.]MDD5829639.1 bifunctional hydroxymethylpyrimidine kinase/phosphomethylpyrimidine kinase [Lachnospira sp.]
MKKVLTIAGSDSSGGAGVQADLKTIAANRLYGMSVITALTAQNTLGVEGVYDVDADFVQLQMKAVFEDIFPDAVKVGMVSDADCIKTIAENLKKYEAKNIVVDTVMVSTSGHALLKKEAVKSMVDILLPVADIITPNIPEAEVLSGIKISGREDMLLAGRLIYNMINEKKQGGKETYVCVKGGHLENDNADLLIGNGEEVWYENTKIDNPNTHGTGCTLSSAIACGLAEGLSVKESVSYAKEYITGALKTGFDIGKGNGPLNHMYKYMD